MSTGPSSRSVRMTASAHESKSVTSPAISDTRRPSPASLACQLRPSSPLVVSAMSSAATLHSCRINRSQIARPSSPIPPVTSATLSSIRIPPRQFRVFVSIAGGGCACPEFVPELARTSRAAPQQERRITRNPGARMSTDANHEFSFPTTSGAHSEPGSATGIDTPRRRRRLRGGVQANNGCRRASTPRGCGDWLARVTGDSAGALTRSALVVRRPALSALGSGALERVRRRADETFLHFLPQKRDFDRQSRASSKADRSPSWSSSVPASLRAVR